MTPTKGQLIDALKRLRINPADPTALNTLSRDNDNYLTLEACEYYYNTRSRKKAAKSFYIEQDLKSLLIRGQPINALFLNEYNEM